MQRIFKRTKCPLKDILGHRATCIGALAVVQLTGPGVHDALIFDL